MGGERYQYNITAAPPSHLRLDRVIGGYDGGDTYSKDILEYRDGNGWRKVGSLKNARSYHALSHVKYMEIHNYCN